jgi:hypothetical protein
MPTTPFGFKFYHSTMQMNYEVVKKVTSKLTQLLLILIKTFNGVYHGLPGSFKVYQVLSRLPMIY